MTDKPNPSHRMVVINDPFTDKPKRDFSQSTDVVRLKRIMDGLANDRRIIWENPVATKPNEFIDLFGEFGGLEGVLIVQATNHLDRFIGDAFRGFGFLIEEVDGTGLWFIGSDEAQFYAVKMRALREIYKRTSLTRSFDDPEEVI